MSDEETNLVNQGDKAVVRPGGRAGVNDPTVVVRSSSSPSVSMTGKPDPIEDVREAKKVAPPPVPKDIAPKEAMMADHGDDDSSTRLVGFKKATDTASEGGSESKQPMTDTMKPPAAQPFNPEVGWLVVISGSGRGRSRPIFNQYNSVGREKSNRIPLDFGDETISRHKHATIAYDDRSRTFYISHGGESENLVRVNGKVVLTPIELTAGDRIEIGHTTVVFVPLCGPNFDWSEIG